jgi:hypothetical protein
MVLLKMASVQHVIKSFERRCVVNLCILFTARFIQLSNLWLFDLVVIY